MSETPTISYPHVYIGSDGHSRIHHCTMKAFTLDSVGPDVADQWMNKLNEGIASVTFSVLPVGWVGDWHPNPHPQWVVPLSGRWFVQTQDGTRLEMGPGEVHFGEDQNCLPDDDGNVGHLSGTVGHEPCVQMMIALASDPTRDQPCRFS
ncbi:hypothetical protein [Rhodococcus sp. NPDC058521]|uniref:hypothetical protein n=1 Tax=Rhodococcus sp. NPDC058521 TaxID=3346536 RepID=UPI00365E8120